MKIAAKVFIPCRERKLLAEYIMAEMIGAKLAENTFDDIAAGGHDILKG